MKSEDPEYKLKRKELSTAFSRSQIKDICETIKEITLKQLRATDSQKEVNLAEFTIELQGRIVVNVACGAGVSSWEVDYENKDGTMTKMHFGKHVEQMLTDVLE